MREPGEYLIRQISDPVLQIVKNPKDPKEMTVEASVITSPTENNKLTENTALVLNRIDNEYYFDKKMERSPWR